MTPELERLLQREPTDEEIEYADTLADALNWENLSGDPRPRMASGRAENRRTVALAVLREAAKLVCWDCAHDTPLITEENFVYHDDGKEPCVGGRRACNAVPIHAIIALCDLAEASLLASGKDETK